MSQQFPNQRHSGNSSFSSSNQTYQNQNVGASHGMNQRQGYSTNHNYGNVQFSGQNLPNLSHMSHGHSGPQGPIVQHVMIPVPVPVSSNIPPHLLRPQIISTSGGSYANMNQGQIITPQFQGMPNPGQAFYSPPQQGQFTAKQEVPEHSAFRSRDRKKSDDLSYYLGKDQRDNRRSRSSSQGAWRRSRSPNNYNSNTSKYAEKERDYKSHSRERRSRSREHTSRSRDKRSRSREHERSRRDSFEDRSERRHESRDGCNDRYDHEKYGDTDRRHNKRYENKSERSYGTDKSRHSIHSKNSGDYNRHSDNQGDMYEQSSRREHFESPISSRHDQIEGTDRFSRHSEHSRLSGRSERRNNTHDRTSEVRRSVDMDDYVKSDRQNFNRHDNVSDFRTERYEPDRYDKSDRRSEQIEYEERRIEGERRDFISDDSRNKIDTDYHDNRGDLRNVLLKVRNDPDSNYHDNRSVHSEHRSNRCDRDNYDDRKRKNSFGSIERYGKQSRRDYSPVSDRSKPHDDIKIHISDRGRWIESYSNEGDVQNVDDNSEFNCILTYDSGVNDNDLLDGTEMVSDNESITERHHDRGIHHSRNVRSRSPRERERDRNYRREHDRGRSPRSPTHSRRSRHSDDKLQPRLQSFHEQRGIDGSERGRNTNPTKRQFDTIPLFRELLVRGNPLKVPDLCPQHNQKGCDQTKCCLLHICKHHIFGNCKFGDMCTKSHDLFKGQPFWVLKTINPGLESSGIVVEDIEKILKDRISLPQNYDRGRSPRSPTHSRRSRHSDDRLQPRERSFHEHKSIDESERSRSSNPTKRRFDTIPLLRELFVRGNPLKVPDMCPPHNQKGCDQAKCCLLHVCKHHIIRHCKFGEKCTKSHDLFKGQPFWVLKTINPGLETSDIVVEDIEKILKDRISLPLKDRNEHDSEMHTTKPKFVYNPAPVKQESVSNRPTQSLRPMKVVKNLIQLTTSERKKEDKIEVDPSFDARNYATDGFITNINEEVKKKVVTLKTETNIESDSKTHSNNDKHVSKGNNQHKNVSKDSDKQKNESKDSNKQNNEKKSEKCSKTNDKSQQKVSSENRNDRKDLDMSPVSGEEDDWEQYEKYETVSEDNASDNDLVEHELDNVSSDESVEEVIHSCAIDSFPVPTPQNIAVPIGMNDPLVFNRPLKNNPSSYVGPMNFPPPMFPIANNAPLFPILQSNVNTSLPPPPVGFPGAVTGVLPNHLPSPELMSEVIKNLPKFTVPPPESSKTFKNDTNPVTLNVASGLTKQKPEKNEKDPEMKETIKKLWTFPHKSVINMSVIEFVTETEAYKDELIAEIVRILVTLELPYVTVRKLLTVIKEKIQVCIKSETDLRKILDMYPDSFRVIENIDSDDESDGSDTKRVYQIKANIRLGFCEKHGFLPFAIGKCECRALHICKFYFLNDCTNKHCKFGHKLKTEHNVNVLKQHRFHRLTGEELCTFMADVDNRNKDTIPKICKYYVREKGCYKGDSTDFDSICHSLHLCSYVIKGKCMNRECERSHSIFDKQPMSLLQKFGLDPNELGAEKVLQMLNERALLSAKDSTPINPMKFEVKRQAMPSRKQGGQSSPVVRTATKTMTAHYVKNYNNPAICKFYNNETGCRKKDWGSAGKCFFLHICQYYVNGDCKFGSKCKRAHDFYSGQAAEILEKFEFDLDNMSSQDILDRLNNVSRSPKVQTSVGDVYGSDLKLVHGESSGVSDETAKGEVASEVETRVNVERNDGFTSDTERPRAAKVHVVEDNQMSANTNISAFGSCNVEDVIKHIMNQNKLKQQKAAMERDSSKNVNSGAKKD